MEGGLAPHLPSDPIMPGVDQSMPGYTTHIDADNTLLDTKLIAAIFHNIYYANDTGSLARSRRTR